MAGEVASSYVYVALVPAWTTCNWVVTIKQGNHEVGRMYGVEALANGIIDDESRT